MALGTAYPVLRRWHLVLLIECSEDGSWYCLSSAQRMALGIGNPVLRRWHLVLVIECSEDGTWYC
jgi:predicted GIY-YIG superfamily endonuclease